MLLDRPHVLRHEQRCASINFGNVCCSSILNCATVPVTCDANRPNQRISRFANCVLTCGAAWCYCVARPCRKLAEAARQLTCDTCIVARLGLYCIVHTCRTPTEAARRSICDACIFARCGNALRYRLLVPKMGLSCASPVIRQVCYCVICPCGIVLSPCDAFRWTLCVGRIVTRVLSRATPNCIGQCD